MIAFLGSVFSPYYAWSRRRGGGDPMQHCALNVALYGRKKRWSMTERGAEAVSRGRDFLAIGPSTMSWDGTALTVEIREISVPLPRSIRGTVRLYPSAVEHAPLVLDTAGRHRWQPIAPCARAEIRFDRPDLRWSGSAYFDTNNGDRPLEADFVRWDWSRTPVPGGTAIVYDVQRRDGSALHARRYDAKGGMRDFDPGPVSSLPRTLWRVPRFMHGTAPSLTGTLEDTPFYARSLVSATVSGHRSTGFHEALVLDRFASPWVQAMLPFRMPRVAGKISGSSPARN